MGRLRFELRMPKSVSVIDFLPKTQTTADALAQNKQQFKDSQTEVRVEYGGGLKTEFNAFGARFSLGGGGERQSRDFTQVKTDIQIDRLPPRKQVIVAGTDDEGQTLYWELPQHSQATRAGLKEYAILAEVAKDWTGDVGALICSAKQDGHIVASMGKAIGLFLNGDNAARGRAEEGVRKAPPVVTGGDADVFVNSIDMKLMRIPSGSYLMGVLKRRMLPRTKGPSIVCGSRVRSTSVSTRLLSMNTGRSWGTIPASSRTRTSSPWNRFRGLTR